MFDFLKKKISGFVDKITGKKEEEAEKKLEKISEEEKAPEGIVAPKEAALPKREKIVEKKETPTVQVEEINGVVKPRGEKPELHLPPERRKTVDAPKPAEIGTELKVETKPIPKPEATVTEKPRETKGEERVKLSLVTQVKSLFSSEVELNEKDIGSALEDFELELLEGDVAFEVAEQIKGELRQELIGKKVRKNELQRQISTIFFNSIRNIMSENTGIPILEQVKRIEARPVKIMFTGPNGSGKTTTIAKVANLLRKNGFGVVMAAADTFRAAAIEQMEIHGSMPGVKVIKGKYGADPTSVAFDAVNHAKAHNLDVVLIDTAGRQETNENLLNELKKMVRVIGPEIKVYVGESIAGKAVIEQVETFNKELKMDGVILTKLDCDAKGGTVISISKVTRVPVLYVTTGQGYEDIEIFDAEKIARNIAG